MPDLVYQGFLRRQLEEGLALAQESDLLTLVPLETPLPEHYLAVFHCNGLVRRGEGEPVLHNEFHFGITFAPDHLRVIRPAELALALEPRGIWHPNIALNPSGHEPFICLGRVCPGIGLTDVLYQIFEILTFKKVTMREGLNHEACAWARRNQERFPIDPRPLKRRAVALLTTPVRPPEKRA